MFSEEYKDIEKESTPVTSNGLMSINDMLDMTGKLYNKLKNKEITIPDADREYRDFRLTYPVVYRLMIDHGEYNRKAFRLYLEHLATKNNNNGVFWKNGKEFAQSQSMYLVNIFKFDKHKRTRAQVLRYKQDIEKTIQIEWANLEKKIKQLERLDDVDYYTNILKDELVQLSKLSDAELQRLANPNWSAALGHIIPDCS